MPSLKTNVALNFLNTVTGIVFPVITFPYAARVLLPEGIGAVNFLQSIVAYIVLLTSLGIPMYAVREVAKYRDDVAIRNRITVEILLLSVILCLFGYVAVAVLGIYVPQISAQLGVFYALSLTILFTSLGVNWFYQAVEDFKFITIRALCFRMLAALGLFLFVRDKDDLLIYAFVLVGSTVGNNLINFIHLRKWIPFHSITWAELRIWRHLRPSLRIFVFNLVTSIYLNLNTVMLGFMRGDDAVGFYTAGNKLSHVVLSVVASLGVVLLPRCSNLIETGQMEAFLALVKKELPNTAILLTTPPECYRRVRSGKQRTYVRNDNTERAARAIRNVAKKEEVACWDLFTTTGGKNSCRKWHSSRLMGRDRIHFTKEGYQEQGTLLFRAFMESYNNR